MTERNLMTVLNESARPSSAGRALVASAVVLLAMAALVPGAAAQGDEPPEGIRQLLPRGGIPAIFEPEFVSAGDADIPDSAWVLGVYLNGDARAYDLNILNHHEIVNDVIGGQPVAPVW
jgi:hypothetical protein